MPVGATYPGIQQVKRVRYTNTLGITPGVVQLDIVPQETGIAAVGNCIIGDGTRSVVLDNCCTVQSATRITMTDRGHIQKIRLLDRRWRWQYSHARFNKSLIGLRSACQLLFAVMGENNANISVFSDEEIIDVELDCERADLLLQKICSDRGCAVTYDCVSGVAGIVRLGYGVVPGTSDIQTIGNGFTQGALPAEIALCCDETLYQSRLVLEAVGEDVDGAIRPINELSYAPEESGWTREASEPQGPTFLGLTSNTEGVSDETVQEIARRSIFKWYRVKCQVDGSFAPPGYLGETPITEYEQYLPLKPELATTSTVVDLETGFEKTLAQYPVIRGRLTAVDDKVVVYRSVDYKAIYPGTDYTIDRKNGIVRFSRHLFRVVDGLTHPADLTLEVAYNLQVENPVQGGGTDGYQTERYIRIQPTGLPASAGVYSQDAEEIQRQSIATYENDDENNTYAISGFIDNFDEVQAQSDTRISDIIQRFQGFESSFRRYRGIQRINPNGVVRQVSWVFDCDGGNNNASYTLVSLNMESDPYSSKYAYLLDQEENRRVNRRSIRLQKRYQQVQEESAV